MYGNVIYEKFDEDRGNYTPQKNQNLYSMTCLMYINLFESMNGLAPDPNPREIWKKCPKYTP